MALDAILILNIVATTPSISLSAMLEYRVVPTHPSPDGRISPYEVASKIDSGHAHYGTHLVQSRGAVLRPEDWQVIFAGYYKFPLTHDWRHDTHIRITCTGVDRGRLAAKAAYAVGIQVELVLEE